MDKKEKINSLFELLCLNDSKELRKFLLEHSKRPKAFCPIMFEIMFEEREEIKNNVN